MGEETASSPPAPTSTASKTPVNENENDNDNDNDNDSIVANMGGFFRGVAAATRKMLIPLKKAVASKVPKGAIRAIGENRPLAFASEGAVAGDKLLPRMVYYGAWGLSGTAIAADIYTKYEDAPEPLQNNTALYWTAFHVPASLVVPAVIIHQIVHTVEHAVENPKGFAKAWSPRVKAVAPVAAALLSIIPVVPVVDHAAEYIMEPTLGKYLGMSFEHHHDHDSGRTSRPTAATKED